MLPSGKLTQCIEGDDYIKIQESFHNASMLLSIFNGGGIYILDISLPRMVAKSIKFYYFFTKCQAIFVTPAWGNIRVISRDEIHEHMLLIVKPENESYVLTPGIIQQMQKKNKPAQGSEFQISSKSSKMFIQKKLLKGIIKFIKFNHSESQTPQHTFCKSNI